MISAVQKSIRTLPSVYSRTCSSITYKPIKRPKLPDSNTDATIRRTANAPANPNNGSADESIVPSLDKRLQMRIAAGGPITVAQYMKDVLTNWAGGYYTSSRDVIGQQGDFITSPEIGQIFGELVAIWLYVEWQKCGSPKPLQLVELGPGRGTMVQDILRVLSKLGASSELSVHLVEISPFLSEVQAQRLCLRTEVVKRDDGTNIRHYRSGETVSGIPVYWYERIQDVPSGFSVVLAHEFFDALPVHKFLKQDDKWREVMVDYNQASGYHLVASKAETAMLKLFLQQLDRKDEREHAEHSFEVHQIVEHIARRLESDGGFGLIMDYGHFGEGTDTFRAFKGHKLHDPLVDPGSADLTADVNFRHIQRVCEEDSRLITFGPVEQGIFLDRLGGTQRIEQLIAGATTQDARDTLRSGYKMLTAGDQMGTRFKFFAMFPSVLREHLQRFPVSGFH